MTKHSILVEVFVSTKTRAEFEYDEGKCPFGGGMHCVCWDSGKQCCDCGKVKP